MFPILKVKKICKFFFIYIYRYKEASPAHWWQCLSMVRKKFNNLARGSPKVFFKVLDFVPLSDALATKVLHGIKNCLTTLKEDHQKNIPVKLFWIWFICLGEVACWQMWTDIGKTTDDGRWVITIACHCTSCSVELKTDLNSSSSYGFQREWIITLLAYGFSTTVKNVLSTGCHVFRQIRIIRTRSITEDDKYPLNSTLTYTIT